MGYDRVGPSLNVTVKSQADIANTSGSQGTRGGRKLGVIIEGRESIQIRRQRVFLKMI